MWESYCSPFSRAQHPTHRISIPFRQKLGTPEYVMVSNLVIPIQIAINWVIIPVFRRTQIHPNIILLVVICCNSFMHVLENKMTCQCLEKIKDHEKIYARIPRDAKIMLVDLGHLNYPEIKILRLRGFQNCSVENWGYFGSIISANSSFSSDRKSTLLRGLAPLKS